MLTVLVAGVVASVASLIRRERPTMLPTLGLIANIVLVGLFWHFRFYALGFDQDRSGPSLKHPRRVVAASERSTLLRLMLLRARQFDPPESAGQV
jgi:hypothetical protein